MAETNIGILHPGEMGISVAAAAQKGGNSIYWASEGRSLETRQRAEKFRLNDVHTVERLCEVCSLLICVCPPHAAQDMAVKVQVSGFEGVYVDANAISPQKARVIGQIVEAAGAKFVDGGIIGPPAWEPDRTWLYLSGDEADFAASFFKGGLLGAKVIQGGIGAASALKMCYAAYTKGTSALLCAILATAEALGIRDELATQWSSGGSDFANQSFQRVRRVTAKSWRFAGEMDEISATFEAAGMPGGFHAAASEVYHRLAGFKDMESLPDLDEVLNALIHPAR
jgi:3-hydroxyisobutyrate dehydrogenase-like beta-hydroxyacid dehydrogenase